MFFFINDGTLSSAGASMIKKWSAKCTHALLDDNVSLNADLVDAIMSKRHIVSYKWIEVLLPFFSVNNLYA